MMAYKYPKNTGLLLGKAVDSRLVELYGDLHTGDGIRVEDKSTISKITAKGKSEIS